MTRDETSTARSRVSRLGERLRGLASRGTFAQRVATQSAGILAAQVITVAGAPVLTRLYSPADFGILATYISMLAIGSSLATLHYDVAVPLPADDDDAMNLLAVAVVTTAVVTVLSLIVAGLLALTWPHDGSWRLLRELWWLPPMGIGIVALSQECTFWFIRRREDGPLASNRLLVNGGQLVSQVALGWWGAGGLGLLVGDVLGRLAATGALLRTMLRRDRTHVQAIRRSRMRMMAVRYRRFPLLSGPSSVLDSLTGQLPALLLAAFYGPAAAGLYFLSYRILGLPMALVGTAISNVYYGELAPLARVPGAQLTTLFRRTTLRLGLIGTPPILLLAIVGPSFFGWVFGPEWAETGSMVRLLAPMLVLQFMASPLGSTLDVLERQDLHLRRELLRLSLVGGSLTVAHLVGATLVEALLALTVAASLGSLTYIATTLAALRAHAAGAGANPAVARFDDRGAVGQATAGNERGE